MGERVVTIAGVARRFTSPTLYAVELAVAEARRSPCAKSTRGVAVYDRVTGDVYGAGFNGPPGSGRCAGTLECRAACGKVCVHAEVRALRVASIAASHAQREPVYLDAVHVKVAQGRLVGGGGPSCWQCSREVLDVGIGGFWLLQLLCECDDVFVSPGGHCWRHGERNGVVEWTYYTAAEFHAATLEKCELPAPRHPETAEGRASMDRKGEADE